MEIPGVFATSFQPDGEPVGTAVVLPGRGYPPVAPLLWFCTFALLQHGWTVRHVWWDPPPWESDEQTVAWVGGELVRAVPSDARVIVVGKSLGTYAAPLAAERSYQAIWLTPLLDVEVVTSAIAANRARQLIVGGTADEGTWLSDVARRLGQGGCDVFEVPDADHGMLVRGDIVRGAEVHVEVTRTVQAWLASL